MIHEWFHKDTIKKNFFLAINIINVVVVLGPLSVWCCCRRRRSAHFYIHFNASYVYPSLCGNSIVVYVENKIVVDDNEIHTHTLLLLAFSFLCENEWMSEWASERVSWIDDDDDDCMIFLFLFLKWIWMVETIAFFLLALAYVLVYWVCVLFSSLFSWVFYLRIYLSCFLRFLVPFFLVH